jgi:hypothetical protein
MKKKLNFFKQKMELTAMAATYAEAGEWNVAEDYLKKIEALNRSQHPKMMVVSLDSGFLSETVEYSVNLAERMQYDLLAVSALQPNKGKKRLEPELPNDLTNTGKDVFGSIVQKANECRIPCETIITVSDFRIQLKKLLKKIRNVELVLIQVDKSRNLSLSLDIPVFRIETGQAHSSPPGW